MCDALIPAVERHPHSSSVSYISAGMDATISEGSKNLRFVNTNQDPLKIVAETNEGTLSISLYLENGEEETEAASQEENAAETEIVGPARDLVKNETSEN